jgi:hypothetical protein
MRSTLENLLIGFGGMHKSNQRTSFCHNPIFDRFILIIIITEKDKKMMIMMKKQVKFGLRAT